MLTRREKEDASDHLTRKANEEQHENVRDEEGATSIIKTDIRKSPDIAQAHGQAQAGQEKLAMVAPALTL